MAKSNTENRLGALTRKKNLAEDEIHTGYKIRKDTSDLSLLAA
jgi:hypothetical protein